MIPNFSELQELRRLHSESSSSSSSTYAPKRPFVKKDWKNKGAIMTAILPDEIPIPPSPNLISDFLTFSSQAESQRRTNVEGLLDTGCLVGDKYNIKPILQSTAKLSVCSGHDNTCYDMSKSVIVSVNFFNERVNKNNFEIKAIILDSSPLDLITGRSTIKKYGLVRQILKQFEDMRKVLITEGKTSEHVNKRCGCQPKEDLLPSRSISKGQPLTSPLKEPTAAQTSRILASLVLESEQLSRASLYDDDEIDHDKTDPYKPWPTTSSDTDILSLIYLSGDEDLQSRLRTLCAEFADIFSNELPKDPADIPPFNLIVDDTKWKVGKNRTSPRSQSQHTALFKTIQTLISQGIVEKSQSPLYSQILMVPKPDGTFRMCVDYRALNHCTADASWPIPNS